MKICIQVLVASFLCCYAWGQTVVVDKVQQRYPWNGLVDIDYHVEGLSSPEESFAVDFIISTTNGSMVVTNQVLERGGPEATYLSGATNTLRYTWNSETAGPAWTNRIFKNELQVQAQLFKTGDKLVDTTTDLGFYIDLDLQNGQAVFYNSEPHCTFTTNILYKTSHMVFKRIMPPSAYRMGATVHDQGVDAELGMAAHDPHFIAIYEMTQSQARHIQAFGGWMGEFDFWRGDGVYPQVPGDTLPANNLSYDDLRGGGSYPIDKTIGKESLLGKFNAALANAPACGYTLELPKEIIWECAARGYNDTEFFFYEDRPEYGYFPANLGRYAWYNGNGFDTEKILRLQPVGSRCPNQFGLYDMYGSVREWCLDWMAPLPDRVLLGVSPSESALTPPERVVRGGSVVSGADKCNSAARESMDPYKRDPYTGVRLMISGFQIEQQ